MTAGWMEALWRLGGREPPGDAPVAFGGCLSAMALLTAHRNGLLPMPCDTDDDVALNELLYADRLVPQCIRLVAGHEPAYGLAWWSPDPRPVLTVSSLRLGTGLTKTLRARRRWSTTVDRAFDRVVLACRAHREPRWLVDPLVELLSDLHRQGWYHSVEVWAGQELVGGAIGLGLGGVFSSDTMFHLASGASQIALADLVVRLADTQATVLDLQWDSPHVRRLGAVLMDRRNYLNLVAAKGGRVAISTETRSVDDLLASLRNRTGGTDEA
jgi:leucyl/phenylalanyl-tRNA--protein transferase